LRLIKDSGNRILTYFSIIYILKILLIMIAPCKLYATDYNYQRYSEISPHSNKQYAYHVLEEVAVQVTQRFGLPETVETLIYKFGQNPERIAPVDFIWSHLTVLKEFCYPTETIKDYVLRLFEADSNPKMLDIDSLFDIGGEVYLNNKVLIAYRQATNLYVCLTVMESDLTVNTYSWRNFIDPKSLHERFQDITWFFPGYVISKLKTQRLWHYHSLQCDLIKFSANGFGLRADQSKLFLDVDFKELGKVLDDLYSFGWIVPKDDPVYGTGACQVSSFCSPVLPGQQYGQIVFGERQLHQVFDTNLIYRQGCTILDLGGGVGVNTLRYLPHHTIILNDINFNELGTAYSFAHRTYPSYLRNLYLNQSPAQDLNLPEKSIDVVFSGFLVKYLKGKDIDRLFAHIYKALKPGGYLYLTEIMPDSIFYNDVQPIEVGHDPNWPNQQGRTGLTEDGRKYQKPYYIHKLEVKDILEGLTRAGYTVINQYDKDESCGIHTMDFIAVKQ